MQGRLEGKPVIVVWTVRCGYPGILLKGLELKEAKLRIMLASSLLKEETFRALRKKIATDSSRISCAAKLAGCHSSMNQLCGG